jgi:hypothetical protein
LRLSQDVSVILNPPSKVTKNGLRSLMDSFVYVVFMNRAHLVQIGV